ncbi:uncharacterized protein BO80DRAFT_480529 [Aspergillus ibericus CBS 121593]|uniref:F-box domain-containing protein n=1 Tax=Aspergillus ibericus CBS 121593 TaxID=1448316 RepID=A0A395GSE7_9EURO|nr:hypothetical protein BO80DRAFT_480529 [Aspergillus ibericus CBS 121593]RAK98134.1 hypothetical protein BO80DRAFT_480529 [Aspergillus ibericus CBS 121593]
MSVNGKIPSIFWRLELAGFIFKDLPRDSLKNLRLTCKHLDHLVVSLSHLFSRIYISANQEDLRVLGLISQHPRIASCVRELVWDVTMICGFRRIGPAGADIIYKYRSISLCGQDYFALLDALPRLPRLRHATLTSLMSRWITKDHRHDNHVLYSHWVGESHGNHLHPTRPYTCTFESPAMRQWQRRRLNWSQDPEWHPRPEISNDVEVYQDVKHLLEPISTGSRDVFRNIQRRPDRAQLLLLAACTRLHVNLLSYCVDSPDVSCHRWKKPTSVVPFKGIVFPSYVRSCLLKAGLSNQLQSLRELSLTLDAVSCRTWHQAFYTEDLETVEIRIYKEDHFSMTVIEAAYPSLKKLILGNFKFTMDSLDKLFTWCLDNRIQTLHLIDPVFRPDAIYTKILFFHDLLSRSVRGPRRGQQPDYAIWKSLERFPNQHDASSGSSQKDPGKDCGVEPAVPFAYLDLPSESEDSDYTSDDSDVGVDSDAMADSDADDGSDGHDCGSEDKSGSAEESNSGEESDTEDDESMDGSDAGDGSATDDSAASDAESSVSTEKDDSSKTMDVDLTTHFDDLAIEPSDPDYSPSESDESSESDEDETDIRDEIPFPRLRPDVGRYLREFEGESFELQLRHWYELYDLRVLIDGYRTKR